MAGIAYAVAAVFLHGYLLTYRASALTTTTASSIVTTVPTSSQETTSMVLDASLCSFINGCVTEGFNDQQLTVTRKRKEIDIFDPHMEFQAAFDIAFNSKIVTDYIANLTYDFQKDLVRMTLRYCPFQPLCFVTLGLDFRTYYNHFNNPREPSKRLPCCRKCSCDPECTSTGDCCPDVPWLKIESRQLPDGVTETCLQRGIPDHGYNLNGRVERIKALVGCPVGTNDELVLNCVRNYYFAANNLSLIDITFVSDTDSGAIYRNRYCGLCNGVATRSMTFWQPELYCLFDLDQFSSSTEVLQKILTGENSCDINFRVPDQLNSTLESCSTDISACNLTGLWREYNESTERACGAYGTPVAIPSGNEKVTVFRNVFCALCNDFLSQAKDRCFFDTDYTEKYTFSGLLRLTELKPHQGERDMQCPPGSLYDRTKVKCRQTYCSKGRELVNARCLAVVDFRSECYELTVRVTAISNILLPAAYYSVPLFDALLTETLVKKHELLYVSEWHPPRVVLSASCEGDFGGNGTSTFNGSRLQFFDMRYQFSIFNKHNTSQVTEVLLNMNGTYLLLENGHVSILNNVSGDRRESSETKLFQLKVIDTNKTMFDFVERVHLQTPHTETALSYSLENRMLTYGDHTFIIAFLQNVNTKASCSIALINILSLRACPMFKISWDEFRWGSSMVGIYMDSPRVHLDVSEYSFISDDSTNSSYILLCVDTYNERFDRFMASSQQNKTTAAFLVSVIFISLSIASLFVSMITYCTFRELRTLPGKNNMALIASLLAAQSMYLLGNFGGFDRGTQACKIIGSVTHFCWLMAIFWMQLCTFHMFRVLSQVRVMDTSVGNTKYCLYHLYAVTFSTIFIVVNVVVSMVTSDFSDIGYGLRTCYISSQRMIEVTFGIPAALVVLTNVVMFLIVVVKLKRGPSVSRNVRNEKNYFLVFAKLSTVTGAAWVFGFWYMWSGIEAFEYTFVILNASQGLFIFLGFVCNKRTWIFYKVQTQKFRSFLSE